MSQDSPRRDDNHRTSSSSKVRKKKKKHRTTTTTTTPSNAITPPILERKESQHETHALERITTILHDKHSESSITSTPYDNHEKSIFYDKHEKSISYHDKSLSYHEKYEKSLPSYTSDKSIGRQASIVSRQSSIITNGIPKPLHEGPTITILHDNPNVSSNVTELFTTSYGCLTFVIFMMCIIIYEILQYRCIIPYAPFTAYTCVELFWLLFGLMMMLLFLIYPNTFRIKIQASPVLSLITLVYFLTFACIPILGWMLFTGVLAPHSHTTIVHLNNHIYRIPTCTDIDPNEAHITALITNIIHSVCLLLMCGWCCAPFNNNREGTYLVYKSHPPISANTQMPRPPPQLPPPTPIPRQSTEVKSTPKTSSPTTKSSSILISISDHEEETPLLRGQHPTPSPYPQHIHHPDPPPLVV